MGMVLISSLSWGQESSSKKVQVIGPKSKDKEKFIAPYWDDRSESFRNNQVPNFIFSSPSGDFSLGVGGLINLTSSYGFGGISNNIDFVTYSIPIPKNPDDNQQYQMYANTSELFFKVVQKTNHGNIIGYFSTNFRGVNNNLQIWQVYVKYRGFEVGQDWSSFVDLGAQPATVNFAGINSMPEALNLLMRYSGKLGKGWSAGISVEAPNFNAGFANTKSLKQRMPDIPAYLRYDFGQSHVKLAGIVRSLRYFDDNSNEGTNVFGWGGALTGSFKLSPKFQLYANGVYGEGIAPYIQDLSVAGLNTLPSGASSGKLEALPAWGYYGALQYNATPTLSFAGMFGQVKVLPGDRYYTDSFYSYAQQITVNMFWNFLPNAQFALEYDWGRLVDQGGAVGRANRAYLMLQYNF